MEKSLQSRYLNSQDQLIISLNQQIQAMIPLKDSYTSLQRYHIKLLHDFESLVADQDQASAVYTHKIRELMMLNEQLDMKKNQYIEQLRNLENQKAKLILERKNMMSCCQTLSSKFNLENEQNILMQERSRQIIESIKRTEQNIMLFRKIVAEIENEIKIKKSENCEIEMEISRKIDTNKKCVQRIQSLECQIKNSTIKSEKAVNEIRNFDQKHEEVQNKIRQQLRKIKDLNEKILCRREELAHLNHQREYYSRLIESQNIIKEDLDVSETKLNSLLERRVKQCERLNKENLELEEKIKNQDQGLDKSLKYKEALSFHISELAKANGILLDTLKRSCRDDQRVHQVLRKKLEGLDCAIVRSSEGETNQIYKNMILREKTNELFNSKKPDKSGSTWIKELDMQNF